MPHVHPAAPACPACGGERVVLIAMPESGPTGERLCLVCGALWRGTG